MLGLFWLLGKGCALCFMLQVVSLLHVSHYKLVVILIMSFTFKCVCFSVYCSFGNVVLLHFHRNSHGLVFECIGVSSVLCKEGCLREHFNLSAPIGATLIDSNLWT